MAQQPSALKDLRTKSRLRLRWGRMRRIGMALKVGSPQPKKKGPVADSPNEKDGIEVKSENCKTDFKIGHRRALKPLIATTLGRIKVKLIEGVRRNLVQNL
jgi:hypothetical protein